MKHLHYGAVLILITLLTFGVFSISSAQNSPDAQVELQVSKHPGMSIHGTLEAISGNTLIVERILVTVEDAGLLSELVVGDEITLKGYLMPDDTFQATRITVPEIMLDADTPTHSEIPQVEICHLPRANPENAHVLVISETALDAHLNHGDLQGACELAIAEMSAGEPPSDITCPPVDQISPIAESLADEFGYEASEIQAATCGDRTHFYDLTYALLLEELSGDSHHSLLSRYEAGESWDQILAGYDVTFDDLAANRVIGGADAEGDGLIDPRSARNQLILCHLPPGYPENAHTITIGQAAVAAHLRHGDTVAACGDEPVLGSDFAMIPPEIPVDSAIADLADLTETGTPGIATLTGSPTRTRTPTASATRPPTSTSVPTLTSTSVPPTATDVPPTSTPIPTEVPPTSTTVPTEEPPTAVPPTEPPPPTLVPPTDPPPPTSEPPTSAPEWVTICHIPPGNPNGAQTMQVSPSEVEGHMAHGDSMGACPNGQ